MPTGLQLPLASLDFFIWVVIMIVWAGAQLLQQKAEKQKLLERRRRLQESQKQAGEEGRPSTGAPEKQESALDAGLREFLEQLSGQTQARPVTPAPPKPVEKPVIQFDRPYTPPPPKREPPPKPLQGREYAIEELDSSKVYSQKSDIQDLLDGGEFHTEMAHTAIDMRSVMVDLKPLRYSPPRIAAQLNRISSSHTAKPDLRSPKVLKQAVIASVLLAPPKAIDPNPGMDGAIPRSQ